MIWRGAGVAERGALEKHYGREIIVGSNPTLSALKKTSGRCLFLLEIENRGVIGDG